MVSPPQKPKYSAAKSQCSKDSHHSAVKPLSREGSFDSRGLNRFKQPQRTAVFLNSLSSIQQRLQPHKQQKPLSTKMLQQSVERLHHGRNSATSLHSSESYHKRVQSKVKSPIFKQDAKLTKQLTFADLKLNTTIKSQSNLDLSSSKQSSQSQFSMKGKFDQLQVPRLQLERIKMIKSPVKQDQMPQQIERTESSKVQENISQASAGCTEFDTIVRIESSAKPALLIQYNQDLEFSKVELRNGKRPQSAVKRPLQQIQNNSRLLQPTTATKLREKQSLLRPVLKRSENIDLQLVESRERKPSNQLLRPQLTRLWK